MPTIIHYAYVIKSLKDESLYKGMTTNLEQRLAKHIAGKTKSNKGKTPWALVYYEEFNSLEEARKREVYFKTAAGRRFLKSAIK